MKMLIRAFKGLRICFCLAACSLPLVTQAQYNLDWAKGIGGSGASASAGRIVSDEYGNIYVTGLFSGTVDFDLSDNVFNLESVGGNNTFLAKYNAEGQLQWAKRMGNSSTSPYNLAVKGQSVYLVGIFAQTANFHPEGANPTANNIVSKGGNDCFFAKYNSAGEYQWAHGIGGTGFDQLVGVYIDKNDDVFLVGDFAAKVDFDPSEHLAELTANSTYNVFFGKYTSSGQYQWVKSIKGTELSHGYAIIDDSEGNVYIAGTFRGTSDFDPSDDKIFNLISLQKDIYLSKYDNTGNFIWASHFGSSLDDQATMLQTDEDDNIYVLALFQGNVDFDASPHLSAVLSSRGGYDISLAKYNSQGHYMWSRALGGTGYDYAPTLLQSSGKLYVSGVFSHTVDFNRGGSQQANLSSAGLQDAFVAVYNLNGEYIEAFKMGGTGNEGTTFLALNNNDDVYVSGSFTGTANFGSGEQSSALTSVGGTNVFIAKYTEPCPTIVTTNEDLVDPTDGKTSLREAIACANQANKPVTVSFELSPGNEIITLATPIEVNNVKGHPIIIDGADLDIANWNIRTSAGGRLMINSSSAGLDAIALHVKSNDVTVKNLVFGNSQVVVEGTSGFVAQSNYFGLTIDGSKSFSDNINNAQSAIRIHCVDDFLIGGDKYTEGNRISNYHSGVEIIRSELCTPSSIQALNKILGNIFGEHNTNFRDVRLQYNSVSPGVLFIGDYDESDFFKDYSNEFYSHTYSNISITNTSELNQISIFKNIFAPNNSGYPSYSSIEILGNYGKVNIGNAQSDGLSFGNIFEYDYPIYNCIKYSDHFSNLNAGISTYSKNNFIFKTPDIASNINSVIYHSPYDFSINKYIQPVTINADETNRSNNTLNFSGQFTATDDFDSPYTIEVYSYDAYGSLRYIGDFQYTSFDKGTIEITGDIDLSNETIVGDFYISAIIRDANGLSSVFSEPVQVNYCGNHLLTNAGATESEVCSGAQAIFSIQNILNDGGYQHISHIQWEKSNEKDGVYEFLIEGNEYTGVKADYFDGINSMYKNSVTQADNNTWYRALVTIDGCPDMTSPPVMLKVLPTPLVQLTGDLSETGYLCLNSDPTTLTGLPAGGIFSGPHVSPQGLFTPSEAGTFTVSYTVDGCVGTTNITVADPNQISVVPICPSSPFDGNYWWRLRNAASVPVFGEYYYYKQENVKTAISIAAGTSYIQVPVSGSAVTLRVDVCGENRAGSSTSSNGSNAGACPYISGKKNICINTEEEYSFVGEVGSSFSWQVTGSGSLVGTSESYVFTYNGSDYAATRIKIKASSKGNIQLLLKESNTSFPTNKTRNITLDINTGAEILGIPTTPLCNNGDPVQLSGLPAGGVFSGPGGVSTSGLFDPKVSGGGTHTVTYTVNGCTESANINVVDPIKANIQLTTLCPSNPFNTDNTYWWRLTNNYSFDIPATYNFYKQATSTNLQIKPGVSYLLLPNTSTEQLEVNICSQVISASSSIGSVPSACPYISGPKITCPGGTLQEYSFTGEPGSTFNWNVTGRAQIMSQKQELEGDKQFVKSTVSVRFDTPSPVTLSVSESNTLFPYGDNGFPATRYVTLAIDVKTAPVITSSTVNVCSGAGLDIPLPVTPEGTELKWTLSEITGTVDGAAAGQGARLVQLLTGIGTVKYKLETVSALCNTASGDLTVNVSESPLLEVNGPAAICAGTALNTEFSPVVQGVAFSWTAEVTEGNVTGVQNGTGNSITQVLNGVGKVKYLIYAESQCKSAPVEYLLEVKPAPPLEVLTPVTVCQSNTPVTLLADYSLQLQRNVQYMEIPDLPLTGPFTLEMMFKIDATGGSRSLLGGNVIDNRRRAATVWINNKEGLRMNVGTGNGEASGGSLNNLIKPNTWHHLALVYDQGKLILYLDGKNAINPPGVNASMVSPVKFIGRGDYGANTTFGGQIGEVKLWNRARSQMEIAENRLIPLKGDEPELISYWKLDGVAVNKINPAAPGTLVGGAGWAFPAPPLSNYVWSDANATIGTELNLLPTVTGIYNVTKTGTNACTSTLPVELNVFNPPGTRTVTNVSVCNVNGTVPDAEVMLPNSEPGVLYKVGINQNTIIAQRYGNGQDIYIAVPAASLPTSGNINFRIFGERPGCARVTVASFTVITNQLPLVEKNLLPDVMPTICYGTNFNITIENPQPLVTYSVFVNGLPTNAQATINGRANPANRTIAVPAQFLTPGAVNTITVKARLGACEPRSISDEVKVEVSPRPNLNTVLQGTVVCENQSITVRAIATEPGVEYRVQGFNAGTGQWFNFQNWRLSAGGNMNFTTTSMNNFIYGDNPIRLMMRSGGCAQVTSNIGAVVTKFRDPLINLPVSAGIACQGGSGQVTVSGSESGVSYQALVGGLPVGEARMGTGNDVILTVPSSFLTLNQNTLVRIRATREGCASKVLTQSVNIFNYELPAATVLATEGVSCKEGNDGLVRFIIEGTNPPYGPFSYALAGSTGPAEPGQEVVVGGNAVNQIREGVDYTLVVKNSVGCALELPVKVGFAGFKSIATVEYGKCKKNSSDDNGTIYIHPELNEPEGRLKDDLFTYTITGLLKQETCSGVDDVYRDENDVNYCKVGSVTGGVMGPIPIGPDKIAHSQLDDGFYLVELIHLDNNNNLCEYKKVLQIAKPVLKLDKRETYYACGKNANSTSIGFTPIFIYGSATEKTPVFTLTLTHNIDGDVFINQTFPFPKPDLILGRYNYTLTETAFGCTETGEFYIRQTDDLTIEIEKISDDLSCPQLITDGDLVAEHTGSIKVSNISNAKGEDFDYTWMVETGSGIFTAIPGQKQSQIKSLEPNDYKVRVVDNVTLCAASAEITIKGLDDNPPIITLNGFSTCKAETAVPVMVTVDPISSSPDNKFLPLNLFNAPNLFNPSLVALTGTAGTDQIISYAVRHGAQACVYKRDATVKVFDTPEPMKAPLTWVMNNSGTCDGKDGAAYSNTDYRVDIMGVPAPPVGFTYFFEIDGVRSPIKFNHTNTFAFGMLNFTSGGTHTVRVGLTATNLDYCTVFSEPRVFEVKAKELSGGKLCRDNLTPIVVSASPDNFAPSAYKWYYTSPQGIEEVLNVQGPSNLVSKPGTYRVVIENLSCLNNATQPANFKLAGAGEVQEMQLSNVCNNAGGQLCVVIETKPCLKGDGDFNCRPGFRPDPGNYIASCWVKGKGAELQLDFIYGRLENPEDPLSMVNDNKSVSGTPQGPIIDGWQQILFNFEVPENPYHLEVVLKNSGPSDNVYFDDLRILPVNATMKSYVYDNQTFRLMAELDENNFATFYEYDEEGKPVRIKKETERGVRTLREMRSELRPSPKKP